MLYVNILGGNLTDIQKVVGASATKRETNWLSWWQLTK